MNSPDAEKSTSPHLSTFEIKSSQLSGVALMLKSANFDEVCCQLLRQYGANGTDAGFFDNDPVIVDFSHLPTEAPMPHLAALLSCLRDCRLLAVAARGAQGPWENAWREVGLPLVAVERFSKVKETVQESLEGVVEAPMPPPTAQALSGTMVVDKPLRSGQKMYARGGDLVVLAMVNQGAEVVADGNIHVYAPLRGKAMAGARGNPNARIFSTCLDPELVSIAGVYRTSENAFPDNVRGKVAQVRLSVDGQERLLIEPLDA